MKICTYFTVRYSKIITFINNFVWHKNWIDTCDVRIQLYWECTNSTLPSILLKSIWCSRRFRLLFKGCISFQDLVDYKVSTQILTYYLNDTLCSPMHVQFSTEFKLLQFSRCILLIDFCVRACYLWFTVWYGLVLGFPWFGGFQTRSMK